MLYLIMCGDPYAGKLQVRAALDGPEGADLDSLWKSFDEALDQAHGPAPQYNSFYNDQRTSFEANTLYQAAWKEYRAKQEATHTARAVDLGVELKEEHPRTDLFVADLIQNHGFTEVDFTWTFTDEY